MFEYDVHTRLIHYEYYGVNIAELMRFQRVNNSNLLIELQFSRIVFLLVAYEVVFFSPQMRSSLHCFFLAFFPHLYLI